MSGPKEAAGHSVERRAARVWRVPLRHLRRMAAAGRGRDLRAAFRSAAGTCTWACRRRCASSPKPAARVWPLNITATCMPATIMSIPGTGWGTSRRSLWRNWRTCRGRRLRHGQEGPVAAAMPGMRSAVGLSWRMPQTPLREVAERRARLELPVPRLQAFLHAQRAVHVAAGRAAARGPPGGQHHVGASSGATEQINRQDAKDNGRWTLGFGL